MISGLLSNGSHGPQALKEPSCSYSVSGKESKGVYMAYQRLHTVSLEKGLQGLPKVDTVGLL